MKKILFLIACVSISHVHPMKNILKKFEKIKLTKQFSTVGENSKSFFKELKETNELLFLDIQKNIKNGFSSNHSPKEILCNLGWYLIKKNRNFHSKDLPIILLSKKMLLYTMGASQSLVYILEEIKKFGPNATVLAGICAESENRVAKFQRFMVEVIFYYQNCYEEKDFDKIKNVILEFLEKSEALKIAHEQNNQVLESVIESYFNFFREKSAEEALKEIEKNYYQTCATIIEWK